MANIFEEVWSQSRLINRRRGGKEDGREKLMELGTVHAGHALHNEGFFSLGALMMLLLQLI